MGPAERHGQSRQVEAVAQAKVRGCARTEEARMAGAISGPRCRSIIPVAVGWYRRRASGHGACRTEGREGDSASRYSQNSQNMPGVLDRPNCANTANTANESPPPPDRLDRGRWPASPPTGPGLPPSRALGPAEPERLPGDRPAIGRRVDVGIRRDAASRRWCLHVDTPREVRCAIRGRPRGVWRRRVGLPGPRHQGEVDAA